MNERAVTHACDLIERQAARLAKCPFDGLNDYQRGWNDACDAIADNAPPAQLELANNSPKLDRGFGEWIPCSERLPKDYEDVLVWFEYFRYGSYNRLYQMHGIGDYSSEYDSWMINHESGWHKLRVLAWMPLPAPYEERREE